MNVWTFTGRLGADAELRTTQSGEKVLGFRVANDVGFGEHKKTQWVDCALWGRRAESLAEHLTKGKGVVISGEVTLREYEKRDGTRGAQMAVRVAELDFMGDGRASDDRGGGGGGYGGGAPPRRDDLDDEIPYVVSEEAALGVHRFGKHKMVL